jgi:hypothetical protein
MQIKQSSRWLIIRLFFGEQQPIGKSLWHMSTSDPFTLSFMNILKHFYVSKNYGVKYIERYIQEEHTQKSPIKNTLYFWTYKKDKFLTKRYTIVLLFYYYLISEICLFYISQNRKYIF